MDGQADRPPLVRERSRDDNIRDLEVERATCDILDRRAVRRAMRGVDRVFHVAGMTSLRAPREALFRINVQGTRIVLEEADCGLLLDVNNLYVNHRNHRADPHDFLRKIPAWRVGQMHMAGHEDRGHMCFDTHGEAVRPEVWELFRDALAHTGPTSVIIEWDVNLPPWERLAEEAATARSIYDEVLAAPGARR